MFDSEKLKLTQEHINSRKFQLDFKVAIAQCIAHARGRYRRMVDIPKSLRDLLDEVEDKLNGHPNSTHLWLFLQQILASYGFIRFYIGELSFILSAFKRLLERVSYVSLVDSSALELVEMNQLKEKEQDELISQTIQLQCNIQEKDEKLYRTQKMNLDLHKENQELHDILSQTGNPNLALEHQALQQEHQKTLQENIRLKTEQANLHAKLENANNTHLSTDYVQLQHDMGVIKEENRVLHDKLQLAANPQITEDFIAVTTENHDLKVQMARMKENIQSLQAENTQLKSENYQLMMQVQDLSCTTHELIELSKAQAAHFEKEKMKLQEKCAELTVDFSDNKKVTEQLVDSVQTLLNKQAEYETQQRRQQHEIANMQKSLQKKNHQTGAPSVYPGQGSYGFFAGNHTHVKKQSTVSANRFAL